MEKFDGGPVHRASTGQAASAAPGAAGPGAGDAPGERFDRATRGAPSSLPYRREMETLFGADFSSVQVYPGRTAEMQQLGARGASTGERVAFGPSDPDRELVAHELTHVLQDRRAGGPTAGAADVSHPSDPAEREVAAEAARAHDGGADSGPRGNLQRVDRISATAPPAGDGVAGTAASAANRAMGGPRPGPPAHGASTEPTGGALPRGPRAGDGTMHALAGITPSNLAPVVRAVDQAWIADAHAAHAAVNAKAAAHASVAHRAAPTALTGKPGLSGASTDAAHPAPAAPGASSSVTPAASAPATPGAPAPATPGAPAPATPGASAPPGAPPPAAHGVTAGPRPRVDLSAEASPMRIDHKRTGAAQVLVDEAAGAHAEAATVQPRTQPRPPAPRSPAPPIATAPVAVEEPRFLASLPPAQRPSVEAALAPVLARRAADVQARTAASQQRTDDEIAQLDARRCAERTQMLAAISARRTQGHAQIDQARRTWQAEAARVQHTHQRAVDEHHARTHARIATLVHAGERQVDTSLTHSESDANGRLAAARAQADAMIASAHSRAEAARASASHQVKRDANGGGDPGDIEASARVGADALLAQVMDLIHQMMQAAQTQSTAQVLALRQQITDLLAASSLTMDQLIDQAMAGLPAIAHYYKAQIDQLMSSVDTEIAAIEVGIARGNSELIAQQTAALAAGLAARQGMLSDITTLSQYTSVDQLRTAFGIDFAGGAWSESSKEIAVLGAVLTERAFRDSAPDGMFDGAGFGSVFQDIMGPVTMNSTPGTGGAQTFWDHDRQHYRIDWYRGVAGNLTADSDLDIALGLDPTRLGASLLHNVIHEFGHVFDGRARKHGRVDTDNSERYGQVPTDAGMRAEMTNQQHTGTGAYDSYEEFADLFLNFVTGGFKRDRAGQQLEQWFEGHLYGNTADGSIPQDDWGWVDIARDRDPASRWIIYADQFYYTGNVYLEDVASYYGISTDEIIHANRDKLVPYVGKDGQRHWRLPTDIWLTIPGIDRRVRPTAS